MAASATQVRLGIDFGTSNTVSVLEWPGRPPTPLLFDGSPVLPSAVFAASDKLLAGRDAERAAMSDPASFEPHPKRCIAHGTVLLGSREFEAVDLVAAVLARVAAEASRVAGTVPGTVVLTHPAGWATERLRLLSVAAYRAGLPQPRFSAEPVAAATHFSAHLGHTFGEDDHIAVYDLGGGTFDVSVVRMAEDNLEVTATGGLADVGGVDIDFAVVKYLQVTYPGFDVQWRRLREPATPADRRHRRGLWRDVRDAKEILSRESSAALFVPVLEVDAHLTRDELEELARPLLRQTVEVTMDVLARADVGPDQLAGLFLVGGASRMPLSSTLLMRETTLAPTILEQPELVVANGAIDAPGRYEDAGSSPTAVTPMNPPPPRHVFRGVAKVPENVTAPGLVPDTEPDSVAHNPPAPAARAAIDESAADTAPSTPAHEPVVDLALTHDGALAVARGDSVVITGLGQAGPEAIIREHDEPVASMCWSSGDPAMLAVATGQCVTLWHKNGNTLEAGRTVTCPQGVAMLSWAPRGLATATDTEILVWDTESGECMRSWRFSAGADSARLRALSWSPDGSRLAAGGSLGSIKLWNETGNPITVLSIAPVGVRALKWSPDGDWLVSGDAAGGIRIWRLSDSSQQHLERAHDAAVQTVAWSPDGKLLASGSIDSRIRLWDAGSGREYATLHGHAGMVTALCWTPDSQRIVSGGTDGTIRHWDVSSGRECPPPVAA